jgi:hypothetical protein
MPYFSSHVLWYEICLSFYIYTLKWMHRGEEGVQKILNDL